MTSSCSFHSVFDQPAAPQSLRESLELDARVGLERLTATLPGRDVATVVLEKRPRVLGRDEPAQRRLSRPKAVEGERLDLSAEASRGAGESYGPPVILELQPDIEARAEVVGVVVANRPKRDELTAGPE